MIALIAANAEIAEEVELGRTLLVQGHLDTAQRVLLKVCRAQPEFGEAFRILGMVLSKRGDDRRARPLLEYADELDAQRTREIPASIDDVPSDAETRLNQLATNAALQANLGPPQVPLLPVPSVPLVQAAPAVVGANISAPSIPVVPPSMPSVPLVGALTLPATSAATALPRKKSRVGRAFFLVFLAGSVGVGGYYAYKHYGRPLQVAPKGPNPREELDRALTSGSLELLLRARDVARLALETGNADADAFARLGLVNAFLVDDYGIEARKDAEAALQRAQSAVEPSRERASVIATARALLAHAAGEREAGKQFVDTAVAAMAPESPALALLASARLRKQAGDAESSGRDLDKAMTLAPDSAPVIIDWSVARLDGGDPVAARRALSALVEHNQENSLASLSLADAERALGEPAWSKPLEHACRDDGKISQRIRALCAVKSALLARIEGDRAVALRKARAVAQTTEDPLALSEASVLLALLGEIDLAAEVLDHAGKAADPSGVALQWAELAVRLGRDAAPVQAPFVDRPAGPERDLLALRAAYQRSGASGVAELLKQLPPGIQDIDGDIRAFSVLGRDGALTKAELAGLERRADKGSPLASYVLGVLAMHDKEFRTAARRLEKSLAWHGDACRAAGLYLDAAKSAGRGVVVNKVALRNVRARNARCALPEL